MPCAFNSGKIQKLFSMLFIFSLNLFCSRQFNLTVRHYFIDIAVNKAGKIFTVKRGDLFMNGNIFTAGIFSDSP